MPCKCIGVYQCTQSTIWTYSTEKLLLHHSPKLRYSWLSGSNCSSGSVQPQREWVSGKLLGESCWCLAVDWNICFYREIGRLHWLSNLLWCHRPTSCTVLESAYIAVWHPDPNTTIHPLYPLLAVLLWVQQKKKNEQQQEWCILTLLMVLY